MACDFDFYDYVWYWDEPSLDPRLGHWLGVGHYVGSDSYVLLVIDKHGKVLPRTTVQHVTKG